MADAGSLVEDDVLRLVLMCAHPALAPEAASALSLRLVLGVPTADIARLFLVPEPTMAARITRAKKRIVGAGIPFAVPDAGVLPERLEIVAQTAYLTFTAGYSPGTGPDLLRADQSGEAIRLVRVVLGLRPDEPALVALLALMLLQHSRRDARVGDGRLVLLADQDRTRWHHDEIAEATRLLARPHLAGPLTPLAASYVLQARIAAEHATAPTRAGHPLGPRRGAVRRAAAGGTHPVGPAGPSRRGRRAARTGRRPRRARGAGAPRRATGPRRCGPSCCPARETSTPRGRRTTRPSRPAATRSRRPSSSRSATRCRPASPATPRAPAAAWRGR